MVRKEEGAMKGSMFALKMLSKRRMVKCHQVQHIKDEKKVASKFFFLPVTWVMPHWVTRTTLRGRGEAYHSNHPLI